LCRPEQITAEKEKKMPKKLAFLVLAAALIAALVLSACGGTGIDQPPPQNSSLGPTTAQETPPAQPVVEGTDTPPGWETPTPEVEPVPQP